MHMDRLHIVSLNHRNAPLERIGRLHIPEDRQQAFLTELKDLIGVQGLAYLTTCNRVEFIIVDTAYFCMGRLQQLFQAPVFRSHDDVQHAAHGDGRLCGQFLRQGDGPVDHLERRHADRAAGPMDERHLFGQQAVDARLDERVRLSAADLHQVPWPGDHLLDRPDELLRLYVDSLAEADRPDCGSLAVADADTGLAFAYVMNRMEAEMTDDIRALSLVPDEVRQLRQLGAAHYLSEEEMIDLTAGRTLDRRQIELVAGRVSARRECFY